MGLTYMLGLFSTCNWAFYRQFENPFKNKLKPNPNFARETVIGNL
jgi:hypothetical protein